MKKTIENAAASRDELIHSGGRAVDSDLDFKLNPKSYRIAATWSSQDLAAAGEGGLQWK